MRLVDKLKWLWDPRTEEQIKYETDPLRRYTQTLNIYIKGCDTPFERVLEFEDRKFGDWYMRVYLNESVQEWLDKRAEKGVTIDKTWYAPDQILRVEIGEHTEEVIQ